jgi:hypothetical protein
MPVSAPYLTPSPAPSTSRPPGALASALPSRLGADVLALTALTVYTLLFYRTLLVSDLTFVGYDSFTYFFPLKQYAAERLARGELPLWNDRLFLGAPFLANIQTALFYPFDVLFLVLPFWKAINATIILHGWLAGTAMYLFCRAGLRLRAEAALVGALAFAFGGYFTAHADHLNQVHTAAWLPLLLLAGLRAAAGTWRWTLAGGAVFAVQLLAGHTQEAYYSGLALGGLAVWITLIRQARNWHARLRPVLVAGAIPAVGAGLAAVQLIPAMELAQHSYRQGGVPIEEAAQYALDRLRLLEALLPGYWRPGSAPSVEQIGYTGVVALVLALLALAARAGGPRPEPVRAPAVVLALMAVLAVVLALGTYTPLYGLLYHYLPGFNAFRAPGRLLLLWTFATAALAGLGLDALLGATRTAARLRLARRLALAVTLLALAGSVYAVRTYLVRSSQALPESGGPALWALASLGTLGLIGMALSGALPARPVAWTLCIALAIELYAAGLGLPVHHPTAPEVYVQERLTPVYLRRLMAQDGAAAGRLLSIVPEPLALPDAGALQRTYAGRLDALGTENLLKFTQFKEGLWPNLSAAFGLPSIDGYDGGLLPTRDYARLAALLFRTGDAPHVTLWRQAMARRGTRPDPQLGGLLGLRYLLEARSEAMAPGWIEPVEPLTGNVRVLVNAAALPRAYVVPYAIVAGPEEATRLLGERTPWFNPAIAVVLEQPPPKRFAALVRTPEEAQARGRASPPGEVRIVDATPEELRIAVRLTDPGFLVVSDAWYPGWRATVDGAPAPILKANLALRAIPLEAGAREVRLVYDPLSVRAGAMVSAATIVGGALLLASPRLRARAHTR